jgi:acetylornithine deacetylase/succinyl-diaminopimelate desuccinylase-like protein
MPDANRLKSVFAHIEKSRENSVTRLVNYLRQPSISNTGEGIAATAQLLADQLASLGLHSEIFSTARNPVVVGRWQAGEDRPTMLFYGHYDTQPPEPLEAWTTPPFEPSIRDGRIYARGAGDNKGQHFAQILAVESWLAVHGELPCNLIVMLDGEEEIGSPSLPAFVGAHRDRLKADLVVTADGSMHHSGSPIIQFGVRGFAGFELRAKGARRDVHSGNFGNIAPNPIWTLIHLLGTMKSPDGKITIDGVLDRVIAPTEDELAAAAALPVDVEGVFRDLALDRLDEPADRPYYNRLMFHPTLTINGLHGGAQGDQIKTIIPSEARCKCEMRLIVAQDPHEVLDLIEAHVRRHAPEVDFIRLHTTPPSRTPIASRFTAPLIEAITTARGVGPLIYPSVGGTLPDYVFTKILGVPTFLIPYANADQANHAPNENMKLECFIAGIRTGAAILSYIGDMRDAV